MTKDIDKLFDDEVTTGATLSNGTTIGGNKAFHLGNDGEGSGLDADSYKGGASVVGGKKYDANDVSEPTGNQGDLLNKFQVPNAIAGVGFDSDNSIWATMYNEGIIRKFDRSATKISKFETPSISDRGVGIDSNDSIWFAGSSDDSIFVFDRSGSGYGAFPTPGEFPAGLAVDSNDSIWTVSNDHCIYQFDQSGSELSRLSSPSGSPTGLGFDSSDSIWLADRLAEKIYELNQSGTEISKFPAPADNPVGLGLDSSRRIWFGTFNPSIYEVDSGLIIGTRLTEL